MPRAGGRGPRSFPEGRPLSRVLKQTRSQAGEARRALGWQEQPGQRPGGTQVSAAHGAEFREEGAPAGEDAGEDLGLQGSGGARFFLN